MTDVSDAGHEITSHGDLRPEGHVREPLTAGDGGVMRLDVLVETKLAPRLQYSPSLGERAILDPHRAQDQREHGRDETVVRERQRFGGTLDHVDRKVRVLHGPSGMTSQVQVRLDSGDADHTGRVGREVQAAPGSNLDYLASQPR